MAVNLEMEALRLQNDALKAENARLKETRAAIYKMYLKSEGEKNCSNIYSRGNVFKALQLSADPDKKEPAPKKAGRKPKAKPDEVAPAEEVKVESEPEVESEVEILKKQTQDLWELLAIYRPDGEYIIEMLAQSYVP